MQPEQFIDAAEDDGRISTNISRNGTGVTLLL